MALFNTNGGARKKTTGSIILEFFKTAWRADDIFYNHNCENIQSYAWLTYDKRVSYGTVERQIRSLRESGALKMVPIHNKHKKEKGWKIL